MDKSETFHDSQGSLKQQMLLKSALDGLRADVLSFQPRGWTYVAVQPNTGGLTTRG